MANQSNIPRLYLPHIHIQNPIYKLPVFGQWAKRIGQIQYMLATPCDASPVLFLEGFFYNLPRLAWSFIAPDLNDSIVNRAGRAHGKRRKSIFNIEGLIEAEDNGIKLPGYGQWMIRLGSLAQTVGFYFLIIDATSEFLVNWMSTVYQWAGCDTGMGAWMKSFAFATTGPTLTPGRILWGRAIEGDGHLLAPGGEGVLQLQSQGAAGVGFSIVAEVWPLAGPPVGQIQAWMINSSGEEVISTVETKLNSNGQQVAQGFRNFATPAFAEEEYQVWFNCSNGYAVLDNSSIWVVGGQDNGLKPGFGSNVPQPQDLHLPLPF